MFPRHALALASLLLLVLPAVAADTKTTITGPYTQGNLTVFLIHGKDALPASDKLLTLGEAIEQKKLIVHETANVNQLTIENVSDDIDVFVQSGDIVKGGQQDRVIACDMIVPPKSGKVPVGSFCCESGRWKKRGSESVSEFGAANAQAGNKAVKLAVNGSRAQGDVWSKVEEAQKKLAKNVGKPVTNDASPSSYQLTLEDKDLLAKVDTYTKDLKNLAAKHADTIGFVIVINGKIEGAELYGSHTLFQKLWPKLIFAAAVDALAEFDAGKKFALPESKDIEKFFADASQGKEKEIAASGPPAGQANRRPNPGANLPPAANPPPGNQAPAKPDKDTKVVVTCTENDKTLMLDARVRKDNIVVHRSYIAK